jgi:hypothetical protein
MYHTNVTVAVPTRCTQHSKVHMTNDNACEPLPAGTMLRTFYPLMEKRASINGEEGRTERIPGFVACRIVDGR